MNKTQTWDKVLELLEKHNVSNEMKTELADLLAPKSGGGEVNPPKLNEDGEIVELWCSWHKCYEPFEDFKDSAKAKTGKHYECKVAEGEWKEYTKDIKAQEKLQGELVNKLLDGELEQAEAKTESDAIKAEIALLKEARAAKVSHKDYQAWRNTKV